MDYCTWFPEGWWQHCCQVHDAAYAAGLPKPGADLDLLLCVAQSAPEPWLMVASVAVGGLMFLGVTLFGAPYYRKARGGQ